jgi:uncharacterized RDD family membrane protein YckC
VDENPYAPPSAELASNQESDSLLHVGKGPRFLNNLIDSFVLYAVFYALIYSFRLFLGISLPSWVANILFYALYIGFYVFFESALQRTPGKYLTKTKVVTTSGGVPSFAQIVGRSFARFIPFDAFSFLGSSSSGWHDTLSKTCVVKIEKEAQDSAYRVT